MEGLETVIKKCSEMHQMALISDSSIYGTAPHIQHLERVLFRFLAA